MVDNAATMTTSTTTWTMKRLSASLPWRARGENGKFAVEERHVFADLHSSNEKILAHTHTSAALMEPVESFWLLITFYLRYPLANRWARVGFACIAAVMIERGERDTRGNKHWLNNVVR